MHLIINTRPETTSVALQQALQQRGLACVNLPGIRIAGPAVPVSVSQLRLAAMHDDIWIFTSINAIEQTFTLLGEEALLTAAWPSMAVLGKGSLDCLDQHLRRCSITGVAIIAPPAGAGYTSEALLQHTTLHNCRDQRILILNAPGGRSTLLTTLQQRGAEVRELAVYRRIPAALEPAVVQRITDWSGGLLTLWTSSESIRFLQLQFAAAAATDSRIGELWQRLLAGQHLVLSARQQRLLQELDAVTISMATAPDTASLAEQLQQLGMH